jgi:hypothetical protein
MGRCLVLSELSEGCNRGGPLAPYLFLLVKEALSATTRKEQRIGRIQGMRQSQRHQLIAQYMNNTSFTAMVWQECISRLAGPTGPNYWIGLELLQKLYIYIYIYTSLNPVPNAQVCVYLTIHITKLQLQTTFPKPLYISHFACIHWDPGRWKSWCLHCLW